MSHDDAYTRGIKGKTYPRSTWDYATGSLSTPKKTLERFEKGQRDRERIQQQEKLRKKLRNK